MKKIKRVLVEQDILNKPTYLETFEYKEFLYGLQINFRGRAITENMKFMGLTNPYITLTKYEIKSYAGDRYNFREPLETFDLDIPQDYAWSKIPKFVKETGEENLESKSLGYNLNFAEPLNIKVKNGFTEVLDAATGFMCIKKEVFYKMKKAYPNLKYTSDQIINNERFNSDNCYAFFDCIIDEKSNRYLSEDYSFCRL